ncbi:hypothetical protein DFH07DRAFT_970605 [Mycena maculata]|uniref:Uncharacterized protein n=1 Tax=Mycena maculata TaxID=230809 RepID=A0AAD7HS92_9AGAR|nr:hypothetical protein DFH07DRAFT_970605 [Mycena maculata]
MYLSLVSMQLASIALGSVFYGMYAVLFCVSMFLLVRRHNSPHTTHKSRENGSLFASMVFLSATLLFLIVTLHWSTLAYRTFAAFVSFRHGTEAEAFFGDHTQPTQVVQNCLFALAVPIGDSLIIHRLWVVWGYSTPIIAVPAIGTAFLTVGGSLAAYNNWRSPDVFSDPWLKYTTIMSLVCVYTLALPVHASESDPVPRTNFYCTGFLVTM